ncbi:venom allergen 3-like [Prorops nasuta]|uniref:venom allergen 3-like n=1 Tax=Prorops nasuta TaxID=863751 RepID=UPI0034CF3CF9
MRYILNPSLYFYLFAAIFVGIQAFTDYCNKKCSGTNAKHTMCLYASTGYGRNCKKIIRKGLTPEEMKILVHKHNDLRAFVASGREKQGAPGPQPAAVHMPNLEWDDELANVAQVWANQCNYGHDECKDVQRFQVGQNIYEMTSDYREKPDLNWFLNDWYDEVKFLKNSEVKKFSGDNIKKVGHYTQIVWAKTTRVGCGLVEYISLDDWWNVYLVCNYGPSGNYYDQPIYQTR